MDRAAGHCPRVPRAKTCRQAQQRRYCGVWYGVLLVHVKCVAHFLADEAFVCEVPNMEITVAIRLVWVDVFHGGLGKGSHRVGGTAGRPDLCVCWSWTSLRRCERRRTKIGR